MPGKQINVKGSFNLAQAFLPSHNPHAIILSLNAGSIQVPGAFSAKQSGYNSSKFATLKFYEILAVENPDVHIVSMHPGVGRSTHPSAPSPASFALLISC